MSAFLMCAVHYKLLPAKPDNKPSSLQTPLFPLSALNRDSRYLVILSQSIPAGRLQAAPLFRLQKHKDAHTHSCTITGGIGWLAWCPENWSLYCASANLSPTSCFRGEACAFNFILTDHQCPAKSPI